MELKGLIIVEDVPDRAGGLEAGWLKAAQHVANKPILHHVLDSLRSVGVKEVAIASSADSASEIRKSTEMVQQQEALRLLFVHQDPPLDVADALMLAAPMIDGSACIVHEATGLLADPLRPLVDSLRDSSLDLVVAVHHDPGSGGGHLSAATQQILHVAELRPDRAALSMAGVCVFGPGALRCASGAGWRSGRETDLSGLMQQIAAAGGSLRVFPVRTWRHYGGNPLDLLELNRIALDRLDADGYRSSDDGNRVEGRVSIHHQASVRDSVIVGPAVIGRGAQIVDAYIGPYTSIGAGARVEGAEIERSIVGAEASIVHVGGRLVASVVGRNARVFRDFSLPRALRLRVGEGTEVALC
jgi:glucose-1-phosphate thymidylyltransferase